MLRQRIARAGDFFGLPAPAQVSGEKLRRVARADRIDGDALAPVTEKQPGAGQIERPGLRVLRQIVLGVDFREHVDADAAGSGLVGAAQGVAQRQPAAAPHTQQGTEGAPSGNGQVGNVGRVTGEDRRRGLDLLRAQLVAQGEEGLDQLDLETDDDF